ncbi:MAG: hypothetical protein U9N30_04340 [Campylobacterota bacterium]|nr:hypothetical protein [Campylobacterota bacterium]
MKAKLTRAQRKQNEKKVKIKEQRNAQINAWFMTPLAPMIWLIFSSSYGMFDSHLLALSITVFISYIAYCIFVFLKENLKALVNVVIVCLDWFIVDIFTHMGSSDFIFIKSSLAETLVSNSIHAFI